MLILMTILLMTTIYKPHNSDPPDVRPKSSMITPPAYRTIYFLDLQFIEKACMFFSLYSLLEGEKCHIFSHIICIDIQISIAPVK